MKIYIKIILVILFFLVLSCHGRAIVPNVDAGKFFDATPQLDTKPQPDTKSQDRPLQDAFSSDGQVGKECTTHDECGRGLLCLMIPRPNEVMPPTECGLCNDTEHECGCFTITPRVPVPREFNTCSSISDCDNHCCKNGVSVVPDCPACPKCINNLCAYETGFYELCLCDRCA